MSEFQFLQLSYIARFKENMCFLLLELSRRFTGGVLSYKVTVRLGAKFEGTVVTTSVESLWGQVYRLYEQQGIWTSTQMPRSIDMTDSSAIRRWGNVSMWDRDADKDVLLRYPEKGVDFDKLSTCDC
jgi:hypothetical protein